MDAMREYSAAAALSRDTGLPIPNIGNLLAKMRAARCAYMEQYLQVEKRENEERRKKIILLTGPRRIR